ATGGNKITPRRLSRGGADPPEVARTPEGPAQLAAPNVGGADVPVLARATQSVCINETRTGKYTGPSPRGLRRLRRQANRGTDSLSSGPQRRRKGFAAKAGNS